MKGKGEVTTYWLIDSKEDNPIYRKQADFTKLKPLFKQPKNLVMHPGANSTEVCFWIDVIFINPFSVTNLFDFLQIQQFPKSRFSSKSKFSCKSE